MMGQTTENIRETMTYRSRTQFTTDTTFKSTTSVRQCPSEQFKLERKSTRLNTRLFPRFKRPRTRSPTRAN